jgi:pimeloyl-ACP methyl ester carboxylesterase
MGGLAALMLAKAHPGDAGKLMIVDSLPFIGTLFAPTATVAMIEPRAKAMRDMQAASYGKPADAATATAIADRLALRPEARAKVTAWAMAADPRVSAQAMYEDMTTDLRPAMPADRDADHARLSLGGVGTERDAGEGAVHRGLCGRAERAVRGDRRCGAFRDARPARGVSGGGGEVCGVMLVRS